MDQTIDPRIEIIVPEEFADCAEAYKRGYREGYGRGLRVLQNFPCQGIVPPREYLANTVLLPAYMAGQENGYARCEFDRQLCEVAKQQMDLIESGQTN